MAIDYRKVKDQFTIIPQNDLLVKEGFVSEKKVIEEHKESDV